MNKVLCSNNHFFDLDEFSVCPVCGSPVKRETEVVQGPPVKNKSFFDIFKSKKREKPITLNNYSQNNQYQNNINQNYQNQNNQNFHEQQAVQNAPVVQIDNIPNSFGFQANLNQGFPEQPQDETWGKYEDFSTTDGDNFFTGNDSFITPPSMDNIFNSSEPQEEFGGMPVAEFEPEPENIPLEPTPAPDFNDQQNIESEIQPVNEEVESFAEKEDDSATSLEEEIRNVTVNLDGKTTGYFKAMSEAKSSNEDKSADSVCDEPTAGWLVCLSGPHLGESFPVFIGRNTIGRNPESKVHISKDRSVSRDKHAILVYEPRKREFTIQPGEGNQLTYLNGENVLTVAKMKDRDIVEVGNSKLLFIALCGNNFSWEDYI